MRRKPTGGAVEKLLSGDLTPHSDPLRIAQAEESFWKLRAHSMIVAPLMSAAWTFGDLRKDVGNKYGTKLTGNS